MDIQSSREVDSLVLSLTGRLDATWADPVEAALDAAVRGGDHRIVLDMAGVDYVSSAGLRVVINAYKQLRAIQGAFSIRGAQPPVANVIELSGLAMLLAPAVAPVGAPAPAACEKFETTNAIWEGHGVATPVRLRLVGGASAFDLSSGERVEFTPRTFGLGIGALAVSRTEALPRLGEFLAAGGCAVYQPTDGGNRPDFQTAEESFIPSAWLSSGLIVEGTPELLLRFDTRAESRSVPLAEIAAAALQASGTKVAIFVLTAETAGLVGAALQQTPAGTSDDPFDFPEIRDRLKFTSERSFRETSSVAVGVVALPGSEWDACLRPLAKDGAILGHVHTVVFPYRPIRKGIVALEETVRALFEAGGLQAVLHLLNDTRDPEGSGDSEFHRGACWVAPVSNAAQP